MLKPGTPFQTTITPQVLYLLGLAVEQGCDEETQRASYGDATVDWLKEQEQTPEWKAWVAETWPSGHEPVRGDLQSPCG